MAKPIEPTPILEGADAERLIEDVRNDKYSAEKEKFLKECKSVYNSTKR